MKISTISRKINKDYILSIIFWLMVWQAASVLIGQEILLVSPVSAIKRLLELIFEVTFWKSIFYSLLKIGLGFVTGLFSGFILAVLSSYRKKAEILLEPLVSAIQSIPIVSFIILFLIWMDSGNLSVIISFMVVFPVVYRNIFKGIFSIKSSLKDLIKVYKIPVYRQIRYIILTETSPYIKSSVEISAKMCWKAGIAAEVIGMPKNSIGENLYNAKIYLSTPDLFAWTIAILVISIIFQKFISFLIDRIIDRLEIS